MPEMKNRRSTKIRKVRNELTEKFGVNLLKSSECIISVPYDLDRRRIRLSKGKMECL